LVSTAIGREDERVARSEREPGRAERREAVADDPSSEEERLARSAAAAVEDRLDVADPVAWDQALAEAAAAFGPVDVLFNVAGFLKPGRLPDLAVEDVSRHLDANAKGAILGTRAAARMMIGRGGHIVNVASMAALAPIPGLALYSASKHAVRAFSIAAAEELRSSGVAVTVVCPDAVATPMLDLQVDDPSAALTFSGGRVLTPREVAELLAGPVLDDRPIEIALPASRAWLARAANLLPGLAAWLRPWLERRGKARQELIRSER